MNQSSHQPTLQDFVRPLRTHRLLLAFVIVAALASSLVYSLSQDKKYSARASLAFQDLSRELAIVGLSNTPVQTADQLASANAETIIQPAVLARVRRKLHLRETNDQLQKTVSVSVQPSSSLVVIRTTGRTPVRAQNLANALAREGANAVNAAARQTFAAEAQELRRHRPKRADFKKTGRSDIALATATALYSEQLSRLQTLSRIAHPARLASAATRPTTPSSPRPVRDALFGGLFGLILGMLAVYLRDSFDRRLRTPSDIQAEFSMPLLGHVGKDVLGRKAKPGLDSHVESSDWEIFRILRRNLDFISDEPLKGAVAVTSAIPEEGKTTVATFLAFASAASGKRTLLIEGDLRRPVMATRLDLDPSPGVTDYVAGDATSREVLQRVGFTDPASPNGAAPRKPDDAAGNGAAWKHELICITAGTKTEHPVEVLRSEAFRTMLAQVQDAYDLVIVDTPPLLAVVDTLELLPEMSSIVVCVRASKTTRQQARAGKAALERLPERPSGLVVTGITHSDEAAYGYYGYY
jgi:Mrp family chromosome partitioning ATPase/capsular polysaccharide biosynthesis protein